MSWSASSNPCLPQAEITSQGFPDLIGRAFPRTLAVPGSARRQVGRFWAPDHLAKTLNPKYMNIPYIRAPHVEGAPLSGLPAGAPNAALLIDFDNVTMGMRSDLSRELKSLLKSDVIRGKVTVQRAYADWRRYPQYIVPLSEASVDLIFAPAYGSSKKNATDIRMAIDGMELVFTRPEIGTFILLTGDSDFSSLVLKLKEYGKYVIGVGIQESSSDILVQNCDEYYSYTSLSGLRKAGSGEQGSHQDPWSLVERAVEQMIRRKDVMRSDRLKQVMLELDASFDEKTLGFSKFSRFLSEAAQKGLLTLTKLENGQQEISAGRGAAKAPSERSSRSSGREREARPRGGRNGRDAAAAEPSVAEDSAVLTSDVQPPADAAVTAADPVGTLAVATDGTVAPSTELSGAYELLIRSIQALQEGGDERGARDSDVKRRMLAFQSDFDEGKLGFGKFSQFLREAEAAGVIALHRDEQGVSTVRIRSEAVAIAGTPAQAPTGERTDAAPQDVDTRRLRPRLSSRRRGASDDEIPPLLAGQIVETPATTRPGAEAPAAEAPTEPDHPEATAAPASESKPRSGGRGRGRGGAAASREKDKDKPKASGTKEPKGEPKQDKAPAELPRAESELVRLGLPQGKEAISAYLTSAYRGVGLKTVERLLEAHGDQLLEVMERDPDAIRALLPAARAEMLLEQWVDDVAKRRAEAAGPGGRSQSARREGPPRKRGSGGRRRGGSNSARND